MHAISPSSHPVIYHVIQITATLARTVYSVAIKCFEACQFLFTQGEQLFNRVVDAVRPQSEQIRGLNLEQSLWQIRPNLMKEDQKRGAERLKDAKLVARMRKEDSRANPGPQILSWLNRIQSMADYDTKQQIINQQIDGFLLQAEQDPVFRESFLCTIDQASSTCGDRMAVSMLYVGLNAKKAKFLQEPKPSKEQMQEFAEFIIRGPWAVQKLQEYAQQIVDALEAKMRLEDNRSDGKCKESIEVFLGLPIKLKQRLRLQIDVDGMLYEGYAKVLGVTEEAVDTAGCMIEEDIAQNKTSILSKDPDWQTMLRKYNPEGYGRIIATRDDLGEQFGSNANRAQWQEVELLFIDQLATLTAEILSGTED
ncbi:MAG: NEL-type E3 ubiquitin ligase domain-containing protein [Chlamydiae bacterium]|nr:NEL-type E3 ubiquitin ligase domain-containing protein [Chlamydiota bacterium]